MDRTILIEYADMREGIKDLRRRIEADKREIGRLNKMIVADSVTCGKKGRKPLRVVKIQGAPAVRLEKKQKVLERRVALLEEREAALLEKLVQVEEYIGQIEKSKIRALFEFYYIDGLTWEMVAMQMNYLFPKKRIPFTKESCRKLHDRFLEKVS